MEQQCEDHFPQYTIRLADGRFQVKRLFIAQPTLLGASYKAVLSRCMSMEQKFVQDPVLAAEYHGQIEVYLKHGQLEPILPPEMFIIPHYWIPHHACFKPSSINTKIRIVFDASARTTSRKSVNNLLAPGPTIALLLFPQLLRFRHKAIAMTADIAGMYRQIYVNPTERDFARIIWRKSPTDPIKHFWHISIPFGFASSQF